MQLIVLWDIDHTLIENAGVSKEIYASAFSLLAGRDPDGPARTEGRTDRLIMRELLVRHGVPVPEWTVVEAALAKAGEGREEDLRRRGSALPGVREALAAAAARHGWISSVLTGNIAANAVVKLSAFGLDTLLDLSVGAYGADADLRPDLVEVARERARRLRGVGADVPVVLVGDSLTVAEWLDRWLAGKRIRKSGISRYETDVRVHLKPHIGHRRLDRLRVSHLSDMFTAITDANAEILEQNAQRRAAVEELATVPWKGAANRARRKAMKAAIDAMPPFRRVTGPATRQHIKATLRASLNDAIGQQIITFNPAAHVEIDPVRKPKALVWTDERVSKWEQTGEKPSPVMVWTPEQTGAFLDFVAEDRLYAMWHLIAFRGLRRGEACGQPWSETNLDRHSLTVTGQLVQDGWEVEASEPKTDSSFRVVALDDDTVGVLERHRKQQEADRAEWGPAWVNTGLVFTQEDGSWLHPGKVTDLFECLVAASSLPPIRLHDLLHGAATLMLAADIDIKIVSDTLGHSDTRITRDIYQSVLPHVGKSAAEAPAKLVPLQRKAEQEAQASKAAKDAKRAAKAKAKGKKKGKAKKAAKKG